MNRSCNTIAIASVAALAAFGSAAAGACTVTNSNGTHYSTIALAVLAAAQIETMTIDGSTGACNENVFVNNAHLKLVINGMNNAVVNGASTGPTLDFRVKAVAVSNLTVTGGDRGIVIQRNANAYIQNVTVQNTGGDGIDVDSMAFAVILGSTIQNNANSGISVAGLAYARIGVDMFEDQGGSPTYQGNTIVSNRAGIIVVGNSVAQIYGNNISNNSRDGIEVLGSSSISTGANRINSNGRSGILTAANASVAVGVPPSFTPGTVPDQTTAFNARYGIECRAGSSILVASVGTLNGNLGAFGQDGTCPGGITNVVP